VVVVHLVLLVAAEEMAQAALVMAQVEAVEAQPLEAAMVEMVALAHRELLL
jgi:hypothetical protein